MKRFSKVMALGALAIASSAAMALPTVPPPVPATAPIPMPDTENSGLFVWVYNESTGASTVQYLGLRLNDVLPANMTGGSGVLDFGILTNFATLFGSSPTDNVFWGVGAGDSFQSGSNQQRIVTTGSGDSWLTGSVANANVQLTSFLNAVNSGCASVPCTSTSVADPFNANNWGASWSGALANLAASTAIGTAAHFFYAETVRGGSYASTAYANAAGFATWLLDSDGRLTYSLPAIPLPAGVWLLLSGLAGFAAVSRRKAKAGQDNVGQLAAA